MNLEDPVPEEPNPAPIPPAKTGPAPKSAPHTSPTPAAADREEVEVTLEDAALDLNPSPVLPVAPPQYTLWEKVSPSARRKKQITTMESGSREVLSLVRSLRENMDQQVLAQKSLLKHVPEAAESVRKLAEYTGQNSELLRMMHEQLESSQENTRNMSETVSRFNDTMVSMDKTTQLLLERAQRSEERLYKILRRSQRRLALLMLLILLLIGGGFFGIHYALYPEKTESWLNERGIPTRDQVLPPLRPAGLTEPGTVSGEALDPETVPGDSPDAEDLPPDSGEVP